MTEIITRDRAAELLNEVCAAEPDRTDPHNMYFEEGGDNACLCVVGAVLEKLGKGLSDLHKKSEYAAGDAILEGKGFPTAPPNQSLFITIDVDGLEFTADAAMLLDQARERNDEGNSWGTIPAQLGIVGVTVAGDEPEQEIVS